MFTNPTLPHFPWLWWAYVFGSGIDAAIYQLSWVVVYLIVAGEFLR